MGFSPCSSVARRLASNGPSGQVPISADEPATWHHCSTGRSRYGPGPRWAVEKGTDTVVSLITGGSHRALGEYREVLLISPIFCLYPAIGEAYQ